MKHSCSHQDAVGRLCGKSNKRDLIAIPVSENNKALRYVCTDHYEYCRPRSWIDDEMDRINSTLKSKTRSAEGV